MTPARTGGRPFQPAGKSAVLMSGAMLLLVLVLAQCERNRAPFETGDAGRNPSPALMTEENAVLRALFETPEWFYGESILLVDSTEAWDFMPERDYLSEHLPGLSPQTLDDYIRRNERQFGWRESGLSIGRPIVFLTREESWSWEARFPGGGGAVTLSRPGFNAAGDQALVYWSIFFAPLAGSGSMALFSKENGQWRAVRWTWVWIS